MTWRLTRINPPHGYTDHPSREHAEVTLTYELSCKSLVFDRRRGRVVDATGHGLLVTPEQYARLPLVALIRLCPAKKYPGK
jgi:hypothetical protein